MARFGNDTIELTGLKQLIKALKTKNPPHIQAGILKPSAYGSSHGTTVAQVGAAHEYGSPARGLPSRSWLRMPLQDHLQQEMESSGALNEEVLKAVIKGGTVVPWMEKIAILAKNVIRRAFDTGGYGKWKAWSGDYQSNTGQILVDTTQLRDSVAAEVVE